SSSRSQARRAGTARTSTREGSRGPRSPGGWRAPPRDLGAVGAGQLDQQAHAVARGALADVGAVEVPGRSGDVEVCPRHLAHEVREEAPAHYRARLARFRRVVEISVLALHQLVVLLVQRQPPDDLAG